MCYSVFFAFYNFHDPPCVAIFATKMIIKFTLSTIPHFGHFKFYLLKECSFTFCESTLQNCLTFIRRSIDLTYMYRLHCWHIDCYVTGFYNILLVVMLQFSVECALQ